MSVSLNKVVDVQVSVSNLSTVQSDFNLGLIVGSSDVITTTDRIKSYSYNNYTQQMIADGFTTNSPEYKAAVAYFSQNPCPQNLIVGRQGGTETPVEALTSCRSKNENFYYVCFSDTLTDANIALIAAAVEAFNAPTIFVYQTSNSNCLTAGSTNVMKTLKDSSYQRSLGFYSTQNYMCAAVMGVVCGLNSMDVNSAYTLAYKTVSGYQPENISDIQLTNLESYNGNAYCNFGRRYNFIYPGIMAGGYHVDEQYLLDAVFFLIQQNAVAGLASRRVIPQTESGVTDIISFISNACITLNRMGVIATGTWTGGVVLDLNPGDSVPNGYLIQSDSIADQSAADRAARKSPPIYVALKASGAIEHIVVRVFVNQ